MKKFLSGVVVGLVIAFALVGVKATADSFWNGGNQPETKQRSKEPWLPIMQDGYWEQQRQEQALQDVRNRIDCLHSGTSKIGC